MKSTILSHAVKAAISSAALIATASAAPIVIETTTDAPTVAEQRIVEIISNVSAESTDGRTILLAQASDVPLPPLPPLPPGVPGTPGKRVEHLEKLRMLGPNDIDVTISSALSDAFAGIHAGMPGRPVKNAPYSAEVINERIQTLPDGNQIVKRTSQMSYRDSAGRTRIESRDANGALKSISIHDAVEKTRFVLNPATKSAVKIGTDPNLQKRVEELREKAKAAMKDGKATIIERSPGEEVVITRVESANASGNKELNEQVRVNVIRASGDTRVSRQPSGEIRIDSSSMSSSPSVNVSFDGRDLAQLAPLSTSFADRTWSSKATTRDLGTKEFDGVRAEGKLRSYTIPAGEIGNKNPITVSNETWTSPDLQMTVYAKHSDPRSGDTIYRLVNVKRTEQPLSLFAAPDGYTVSDGKSFSFKSK